MKILDMPIGFSLMKDLMHLYASLIRVIKVERLICIGQCKEMIVDLLRFLFVANESMQDLP